MCAFSKIEYSNYLRFLDEDSVKHAYRNPIVLKPLLDLVIDNTPGKNRLFELVL